MSKRPFLAGAALLAGALSALLAMAVPFSGATGESALTEERQTNFIFLIDTSGSMVSPRTMVKSTETTLITLFEALRQALTQLVEDERLLGPKSKLAFITFGTKIEEKSSWPATLDSPTKRRQLVENISSAADLYADKHGDTYMAGALDKAYTRALSLAHDSDPCTNTFIIMLTDGWDEPPAGASLNLKATASKLVAKQAALARELGVNTWHVRILGLQRLPEKKAGTTTAAQLASLLNGEFFDITTVGSGTVADRILSALKKTVADLRGRMELAPPDQGGIANFGLLQGTSGQCQIRLQSHSCYGEQLSGLEECTYLLSEPERKRILSQTQALIGQGHTVAAGGEPELATRIPERALKLNLPGAPVAIAPIRDKTQIWQPVTVTASVSADCPSGTYAGAFRLKSDAGMPSYIPYTISIPSRIVLEPAAVQTGADKTGFFQAEPASCQLNFNLQAKVVGTSGRWMQIAVKAQPAKSADGAVMSAECFNLGKPISVRMDLGKNLPISIVFPIVIPARQPPGVYRGVLRFRAEQNDSGSLSLPEELPYTLRVGPSPWEQVAPIAIPIALILIVIVALSSFLAFVKVKHS